MKKVIFSIVLGIACFSVLKTSAYTGTFTLKTTNATLSIGKKGIIEIVQNEGQVVVARSLIDDLWKIGLKNNIDGKEYNNLPIKTYSVSREGDSICFRINELMIGNRSVKVNANFNISVKDDAFCFSGWLKCDSEEWIFKDLEYPRFTEIMPDGKKNKSIYWPAGLGEYISDSEKFGTKKLWYPSVQGTCMPWFSINYDKTGMYIGSHDSLQATKQLNLSHNKSDKTLSASITMPLYKNEFQIPDAMVRLYHGQWYNAAKFYRKWYDRHFKTFPKSEWVTFNSGWLLAILKQQNEEVIWNYEDIDRLCDIAQQFNLGTIGLFGWAAGGHDHLYPNFPPDNLMGGRQELKDAIKRAHKRGIKIILYANAKIMDTSTDFYRLNGIETILLDKNMRPDIQFYIKQKNATPVIFAQACNGSKLWRKTMIDLGMQAVELGADGIIYDQLGVLKPDLCFSKSHDHSPGESDANFRQILLTEVNRKVKEVNPDFIVMTESSTDVNIQSVDYFHGCGIGTAEWRKDFPELFRYTFPELVTTQRNANPMLTRTEANFAVVYGMRHEIEVRYPGDKKYVLNNEVTKQDYDNVVDPPNLNMLRFCTAEESADYLHSLIEFQNKHADFFRKGYFIDKEGIEVKGVDIVAKGFLNGENLGVVVWNKNIDTERDFQISVDGYRLINAFEMGTEKVEALAAIEANSIRLLVYQKEISQNKID